VLAGGTDLIRLMRRDLLSPERVVNVKEIPTLKGIREVDGGAMIGALTTLDEIAASPLLEGHQSLRHVLDAIRAIQIQSTGTIGGDLCHLPNCWYFRNGYGLLALQDGESLVETGDNRYHAILGNRGPAKFVSASRFAPGLIAGNARVRVIGPKAEDEEWLPLEYFYITPKTNSQGVTVLKPGQLITHVWLPAANSNGRPKQSATYEVLQMEGLDWPLAAASVSMEIEGGLVRDARIVLGHVAPVPWISHEAARAIVGKPVTEETAAAAGDAAVASATPLSNNEYKVQLARTAVKRALLRAAGQFEGGL
jgi:xanthine dehydrogenase YagS FAD-binding subunit